MSEEIFNFKDSDTLGRVAAVDTSKVLIDVEDPEMLTRVAIGALIAIKGSSEHEFLIGITERVTRTLSEELLVEEEDEHGNIPVGETPKDSLRTVLIGTFKTIDGEKKNAFKRGADTYPQIDRECLFIEGPNLQRFMGLLAHGLKDNEKLKLGSFVVDTSADAVASGDKLFQRHASVLGSTGSGKSWAVASILERASNLNHSNIVLLDMHGEYEPLTKPEGGFAEYYKIAGPGDLETQDENILFLPYWLLNRDEMLSMILDRSDQNAPNQASRFTLHVRTLKGKTLKDEGKDDVFSTYTVDSPIPYSLNDLLDQLKDDDTRKGVGATGKPVKGDWEGKLTRFISRLEAKVQDRRYGFMFQPTANTSGYAWLADIVAKLLGADAGKGIKVVDFSEVPPDVLPVVTGVFARLLYDVQFWMNSESRTPVCLFCDEAHLYLPVRENADAVEKQALYVFERIAKEGRKYGFSLFVISQRPSDVSKTILSQCNNFLAMRLTNDRDQGVVKRLMPDSMAGLVDMLPLLDVGEVILLGDAVLLPSRIKLEPPTLKPDSKTFDFWKDWGNKASDAPAIAKAVESLRKQTRK